MPFAYILVFVAGFSVSTHAQQERYPQDALDKTWIPLEADVDQLRSIRTVFKETIDKRISLKTAIDKCRVTLTLNVNKENDAVDVYNSLSVIVKKQEEFFDAATRLKLNELRTGFCNTMNNYAPLFAVVSQPQKCQLMEKDVFEISAILDKLDAAVSDNMHIYFDVYNRLSRAIKKKETFEYTLTEAEVIGQQVPQLSEWYTAHKKIIQKIKRYAVKEPSDTKNQDKCYQAKVDSALYYTRDSFSGLSSYIQKGDGVPLIPVLSGRFVCDAKLVWNEPTENGSHNIRLSDNNASHDTLCKAPSRTSNFEAFESTHKYAVGVYKTLGEAEYDGNLNDLNNCSAAIQELVVETNTKYSSDGNAKIAVFKLPLVKRCYEVVANTIRVRNHKDTEVKFMFETERWNKDRTRLVGIDKINECFFYYKDDATLYRLPFDCKGKEDHPVRKNSKIDMPDGFEGIITKVVVPNRFASFFLTDTGMVWVRLYDNGVRLYDNRVRLYDNKENQGFKHRWVALKTGTHSIEDIAAERWIGDGFFGVVLMTKEKKLFFKQFKADLSDFSKIDKAVDVQGVPIDCLSQSQERERLYVHNEKAFVLFSDTDKPYQKFFREMSIGWDKQ